MSPEPEIPDFDLRNLDFNELRKILTDYGHPEIPLLQKAYSPRSFRPTIDYSMWIVHRILKDDRDSILQFVSEIGKFTPILIVGDDGTSYYCRLTERILEHPDIDLLDGISSGVSAELKAFLLLGHLFNINYVYELGEILANVIMPFRFTVKNPDIFIAIHSEYIKFLKEYDPYFIEHEIDLAIIENLWTKSEVAALLTILGSLQPTQRIFLFAESKAASRLLNTITFWNRSDFLKCGIYIHEDDLRFVVDGMAKYEIEELLSQASISFKKSFKKCQLEQILLNHPQLINEFVVKRKIFRVHHSFENGFEILKELNHHLTGMMSSWLLYAFKKDWPPFHHFFYCRCPFCNHEIRIDRKICRYCKEQVYPD